MPVDVINETLSDSDPGVAALAVLQHNVPATNRCVTQPPGAPTRNRQRVRQAPCRHGLRIANVSAQLRSVFVAALASSSCTFVRLFGNCVALRCFFVFSLDSARACIAYRFLRSCWQLRCVALSKRYGALFNLDRVCYSVNHKQCCSSHILGRRPPPPPGP